MSNINAITESNINDIFDSFYSLLTSTINAHAPLKKLTRKQKRLKNKPWITKGLLIFIKRKQKMYKTHYINGSSVAKQCYKMHRNVFTKIKNLAKKCITIISSRNTLIIQKNLGCITYPFAQ